MFYSAEGGELFQRVVVDENFDEQETRRLLRQILEGVLFLHEHSIVHLDIKVSIHLSVIRNRLFLRLFGVVFCLRVCYMAN